MLFRSSDVDTRQMSLRHLALSLLRQRADTMPEDSDADVVKVIVGERRYIPLVIHQGVAGIATPTVIVSLVIG